MLVKIKYKDSFIKGNGPILHDEITKTCEVLAIVSQKQRIYYLIYIEGITHLLEEKYFEVIDAKIPDYWIFKYFKYNNVLKNNKYIFNIILDMYIGPKELINDKNFFFDVVENTDDTNQFLYDTLKKYGKEWKTPPQN